MYVGTWNVNGASPPEGLDAWLVCSDMSPDIFCVCLQEVSTAGLWGLWRAAVAKSLKGTGAYEVVK